jgi:hypothetical protein
MRHLFRVIASIHVHSADGNWKSTVQIPTFLIYASDAAEAVKQAQATIASHRNCKSSGTVIGLDSEMDAIQSEYSFWSDL